MKKFTFETLPDGTNVITVQGINHLGTSYIKQATVRGNTVFNDLKEVFTELEKPLPTDEKTVCPECLKKCTNEELRMFGGLCEECSTDFN